MLVPVVAWQGLFYVVPLALIVGTSFWAMENYRVIVQWSLDNYRLVLTDALYRSPYVTSLLLAGAVVLATATMAYPLAYALAFVVPPRLRPLLIVGLVAPFWTNYLVRAYSWQILIGNNGVFNFPDGIHRWGYAGQQLQQMKPDMQRVLRVTATDQT